MLKYDIHYLTSSTDASSIDLHFTLDIEVLHHPTYLNKINYDIINI